MKIYPSSNSVMTLVTAAFLGLAGSTAGAGQMTGDLSDAMAVSNTEGISSVINATKTPCRVGRFNYGSGKPINSALVFVFQLPFIGERSFKSAALKFHVKTIQHEGAKTEYNASLDGLEARATYDVQSGDFYFGEKADKSAGVTKLQDNILTPLTGNGPVRSVDLSDWLNDQYANGANAGKYVFLRVTGTGKPGYMANVKNGYLLTTADAMKDKPTISYQTTP